MEAMCNNEKENAERTIERSRMLQEWRIRIKKYLELENVSVLVGAGGSYHLGAPIIRELSGCGGLSTVLKGQSLDTLKETYFSPGADPSYEDLFNCLQADIFLLRQKGNSAEKQEEAISGMQQWLYNNCDVRKTVFPDSYKDDINLGNNRYFYHEMLIKKLLQRPNHLRRVNLFTLNYDMALDYALDNLGVHYINGFMGVHNRCFRPEVYDYDVYYPGQSVSGKVHRAEKVIRYYKLHGSLSWRFVEPSIGNMYGIQEVSLGQSFDSKDSLLVYPCVSKKKHALDLPYSEMFRQFSKAITQPQSVLICLGYSFNDEHVNDIIRQALSIPSFTLIVANYSPEQKGASSEQSRTPNKEQPEQTELEKLKALGDKRIIVLDERNADLSTFVSFVTNVMPDLYEEEERIMVKKTMSMLFSSPIQQSESGEETK